jgi:protein-disulfide isomerase
MNGLHVRSLAVTLALCIAGVPAASFAADAFSAAQKDEVRKLVREYLAEHPEAVMEAINALQAKDEKAKTDKQVTTIKERKKDLFEQTDGTVLGNPKGNVTLVEFFDYNCGYCKAMFPALMDTVKADGNVKLVVKEFPILGQPSVTASKAALAARKQNKYSEMHLALMNHKGALTDDGVIQIAKDAGLDVARLQKDMADPAIAAVLNKNHDLAQDLDIQGTPALIIGETLVPGAIDKARMAELIKTARK